MALDSNALKDVALNALEEIKALDIRVFEVRESSGFTDWMVVATGTSRRQLQALADKVVELSKAVGNKPLGVEGERGGEWILIDLGDVVVNIMNPESRAFYSLEKLWSVDTDATA